QQNPFVGVGHDRPDPERHRPRQEKAPVQQAQLQPFSQRRGHGLRVLRLRADARGCFSVQAILLPPGQWRREATSLPAAARRGGKRMSFTIAHITDPHLSPAPMPGFADLRLKRVMGFINWKRGRERLNDMGMLARLVADLRAQRPDHVAVTGDLVNIGMPAEFHRAALWMRTLGEPANVSFVPGNHDAYVRASMPLLEATFAPWTAGDAPRGGATYPYLRVRQEVAIIGLSSAVPTAPLMATGRLGKTQLEAFAELLGETGARGLARVVLIHHPPIARAAPPLRGLSDAAAFGRIVR